MAEPLVIQALLDALGQRLNGEGGSVTKLFLLTIHVNTARSNLGHVQFGLAPNVGQ